VESAGADAPRRVVISCYESVVRIALVFAAVAACSFARPSSTEPKSMADCRIAPPIVDTAIALAISAVAIVAAVSKCENNCAFIQSGAALPIEAIAASFGAGAGYGYYRYGRCKATVDAATAPPPPAATTPPPPYVTP
jgi:hypothetical protein